MLFLEKIISCRKLEKIKRMKGVNGFPSSNFFLSDKTCFILRKSQQASEKGCFLAAQMILKCYLSIVLCPETTGVFCFRAIYC